MNKKRWVIKIGSAILTNNGRGLDKVAIASWVRQIVELKSKNIDVILVSSGSIIEGIRRLKWKERPQNIDKLQTAAAIGQMGLIEAYESIFSKYSIHTAQILLTHDNLKDKRRYNNISSTLNNLLSLGAVPIVNENDTVATEEIKFGDNDTLAALVANLVNADKLVILTDQKGIYDSDPRSNPNAKLIYKIHIDDKKLSKVASAVSGALGSGGMYTKVLAAKKAKESNTITHIVSGTQKDVLIHLQQGKRVGTLIYC